jgi:mono/diheme cytochrome c family protein
VTFRWGQAAGAALTPLALLVLAHLSADVAARVDEALPHPPATLEATGLYAPGNDQRPADGVRPFSPQYPLWTDGAGKRRWIYLPPGTSIDGRQLLEWDFPVGTRLWKEFSFGGRKVETRLLWKATASGWVAASYAWNADGTEATLAPVDGVPAAADLGSGKHHAIPSRTDCLACHGSKRTRPLGFSALQLSDDRDPFAIHGEALPDDALTLGSLVAAGLLTLENTRQSVPRPRIATADPATRSVLGYLASNCGGCHSREGDVPAVTPFLRTEQLLTNADAVAIEMSERATTWQVPGHDEGTKLVDPVAPQASALLARMRSRRPSSQMPPLGTVVRDDEAVAAVQKFIDALAARQQRTQ